MRTFLSYAFRPFFLLNAIFAMLVMVLWGFTLQGMAPDFLPSDAVLWHAHEMISGFAGATIAGFVLTAIATWTGRPPVRGAALGLLVLCWLVGRLASVFGGVLGPMYVLGFDMLFPVLLVILVAREIIGGGSRRNFPIIFICVVFAGLNLLYHLGRIGYFPLQLGAERVALLLLVHLVLLLITVIAGRIIPNFTSNWLRARGEAPVADYIWFVERACIVGTIFTGLFSILWPFSLLTGILAALTALMHVIRLSRWRSLATTSEPLLFILHIAYLWLPVGYALLAMATFGWKIPMSAALHALTAGAISLMILAVSTRVALAHTGRPLHAARLTVCAYVLLLLAGLCRVLSPMGGWYLAVLNLSIVFWVGAFGLFCWIYVPILLAPRVDE